MNTTTRRRFLQTVTTAAGAAAVPYFLTTRRARAADVANDKLGIGAIGAGGRGSYVGGDACRRGNALAVADMDQQHGENLSLEFTPVTAQEVRLNILEATEGPTIWEFQLFEAKQ